MWPLPAHSHMSHDSHPPTSASTSKMTKDLPTLTTISTTALSHMCTPLPTSASTSKMSMDSPMLTTILTTALSHMSTPLPTFPSTSKTTIDLPTLTTLPTTALWNAASQPLSPEAYKYSAPALDEVGLAELEDMGMRLDCLLPNTPDSDHQSFAQHEEDPEAKQPPPYLDYDPHQVTNPPRTGKRPLPPSPATPATLPGLSTDTIVDEGMAPLSEKRRRLTARNPASRPFNHRHPRASCSKGTSRGNKMVKARQHGAGPLLPNASAFDKMKEVVTWDLTKEYV